jgi:Cu+-exporting ATPase
VEVSEQEGREEEQIETVRDPVCGMDIDPATAAASEEWEGNTYYFCSESCHQRFAKAPDQFAARGLQTASAVDAGKGGSDG